MKTTLLLILCMGFLSVQGTAQDTTSAKIAQADSLFNKFQEDQSLELYNQILAQDPRNLSALWHSSLLYSRIGNRFKHKDQKKEYFNKARDRAQQALDVDAANTHANFVMAVAMGRMALIVGAKERVAASRDIKKYADRALEADSSNAGAWHVLGRWNYEISNLNFAERLAANVLFGGIPDGASTEKAVVDINKAIELNPNFILYYRDLAKAYKELGQDDKAIATCQTAMEKPLQAPEDDEYKQDCRNIIKDLK